MTMNVSIIAVIALGLRYLFRSIYLVLLLRVVISWYKSYKRSTLTYVKQNAVMDFIERISDPFVVPFQGIFNFSIDLSPIIVFFLLSYVIEPLVFKVILGF